MAEKCSECTQKCGTTTFPGYRGSCGDFVCHKCYAKISNMPNPHICAGCGRFDSYQHAEHIAIDCPTPAASEIENEVRHTESSIYIKNFPNSWSEKQLERLCSDFGTIRSTAVQTKPNGESIGFVNFAEPDAAEKAKQQLHEINVGGREVLFVGVQSRDQRGNNRPTEGNKLVSRSLTNLDAKDDCSIHVRGISQNTSELKLLNVLSNYGRIASFHLDQSNALQRTATVRFENIEAARKTVKFNEIQLDGNTLILRRVTSGGNNHAKPADHSVYVRNIPLQVSQEHLVSFLSRFGPLFSCQMVENSGYSKHAFASYEDKESADRAIGQGEIEMIGAIVQILPRDREMKSVRSQNFSNMPQEERTLFLTNIPNHWTKEGIEQLVQLCGPTEMVIVSYASLANNAEGIRKVATVVYKHLDSRKRASYFNNLRMGDVVLRISEVHPNFVPNPFGSPSAKEISEPRFSLRTNPVVATLGFSKEDSHVPSEQFSRSRNSLPLKPVDQGKCCAVSGF